MRNKDEIVKLFQGSEFNYWATRDYPHSLEAYFLDKYLDPEKNVLEAGTGGGFLLQYLKQRGFKQLYGFDLIPEFIEYAKTQDEEKQIQYTVSDAVRLPYKDAQFDQAVYFGHLLSLLQSDDDRREALSELHRVLKPGGVALINVLSFEFRNQDWKLQLVMNWLRFIRAITFRKEHPRNLPMLKRNNRLSIKSMFDAKPYFYWFKAGEIIEYLSANGFEVFAAKYCGEKNIPQKLNVQNPVIKHAGGHIFLACRKAG